MIPVVGIALLASEFIEYSIREAKAKKEPVLNFIFWVIAFNALIIAYGAVVDFFFEGIFSTSIMEVVRELKTMNNETLMPYLFGIIAFTYHFIRTIYDQILLPVGSNFIRPLIAVVNRQMKKRKLMQNEDQSSFIVLFIVAGLALTCSVPIGYALKLLIGDYLEASYAGFQSELKSLPDRAFWGLSRWPIISADIQLLLDYIVPNFHSKCGFALSLV